MGPGFGRSSIATISGYVQSLKKSQIKRLKQLSERRIRGNAVVDNDFARAVCALSRDLSRQIGTLVDRQGHVRYVIVGDDHRIDIPDLDRSRAVRMRGLRLIHTHIKGEELTQEDLYDLTLLRLDYITAITFDQGGVPDRIYSAHLLPGADPGYTVEEPVRPGQQSETFREDIARLEDLFEREGRSSAGGRARPRALLVGVYTPDMRRRRSPEDSMSELEELCRTAGVEVADRVVQKRAQLDPVTVVGSGKAREISIQAVQRGAELVIFDLELSAAQAKRMSQICDLKIVDRTQLILDIFARNARSRDGKLQVELAQLRYLKGRLSEKDDNMSRLTGGIGGRGPGETKLEIGRRRVHDRIARLEKELKSLRQRRELNRNRRTDRKVPIVSIVGYTNAGKSTLLNALTNSDAVAEDRLFATLDPTTRRLRFPQEREIILSDTVGFIHELPPELGRAFQATLEELTDASLLIHLMDASDELREDRAEAVQLILANMGLASIPVLRVYNKADCLTEEERRFLERRDDTLLISALKKQNLEKLVERIEERVFFLPSGVDDERTPVQDQGVGYEPATGAGGTGDLTGIA